MTRSPRAKLLAPARTLASARKSAAEAALATAIEQQGAAAERVTRTQGALEAEQRKNASTRKGPGAQSGLELRRHAAHARARQARVRALSAEAAQAERTHAERVAAVDAARRALAVQRGKEHAIEHAIASLDAEQRRAHEQREQDEQDEFGSRNARSDG